MAIDKGYYAILGVHPTAGIAVIEAIFYGFCKKVTSDIKKDRRSQCQDVAGDKGQVMKRISNSQNVPSNL